VNFFEWLRQRWLEFRGSLSRFMERFLNRLAAWLHRICASVSDEHLHDLVLVLADGMAKLLPRDQVRCALDRAMAQAALDDAGRWRVAASLLRGVCAEEEYPVSRADRVELAGELGDDLFLVEMS
jgi:hypothetical protein